MESPDERLIAEFLRGEKAAVERIARWIDEGAGKFRSRLDMPWEDVRQELLLSVTVHLRRKTFRGDAQLRTYLWRMAKYHCLTLLRDQAKRRRGELGGDGLDELPTTTSSPLEQAIERESTDGLVRLLEAMPPQCRTLWKMILADRSYSEMSTELGIAAGTLRVRVLRCRRQANALWKSWREQPPKGITS